MDKRNPKFKLLTRIIKINNLMIIKTYQMMFRNQYKYYKMDSNNKKANKIKNICKYLIKMNTISILMRIIILRT